MDLRTRGGYMRNGRGSGRVERDEWESREMSGRDKEWGQEWDQV